VRSATALPRRWGNEGGPRPDAGTGVRLRWWREVLYAAAFYVLYSLVRDLKGDRPVSALQALTNARRVIRVERWFGIFHEQAVQSWFIGSRWLIRGLDDFYGTAHFAVTIGVMLYLFFGQRDRYPRWRNTLAFTTAIALAGFAFFPLMPPRLLPASYHIVDTLRVQGGLWSFDSGPMNAVSNQYAAMPSLHFAWSTWCALVLYPSTRRVWLKAVVVLYPVVTLYCIVVTGNHYFLDAVGGAACLGAGYALARAFTWGQDAWSRRRAAPAAGPPTT